MGSLDHVQTHHRIVALQTFFCPLPTLTPPPGHTFDVKEYYSTAPSEVAERIRDADIVVTTTAPLTAEILSPAVTPNLKLVAVVASGTDKTDLEACRARGIRVLNSPDCNVDAVAEHTLGLYFAARRAIVPTMRGLRAGEWPKRGTLIHSVFVGSEKRPAPGCRDELAVVIGYGSVGKRVKQLFEAVGMKVAIAGRKGVATPEPGRITLDEALRTASVIVLSLPRMPETLGLIKRPEFEAMREDAIFINIARGGIVDEQALVDALRERRIAGAATDVFETEPAGPETSPLLREDTADLNLVVTPHTAWVGEDTTANYQRTLRENINDWITGTMKENRIKV